MNIDTIIGIPTSMSIHVMIVIFVGPRQGYALSPLLFNIVLKEIGRAHV